MQILSIFVSLTVVVATHHEQSSNTKKSSYTNVYSEEVYPMKTSSTSHTNRKDLVSLFEPIDSASGFSDHVHTSRKHRHPRSSHRSSHSESSGTIRLKKGDLHDLIKMILEARSAGCPSGTCNIPPAVTPQYGEYYQSGQTGQYHYPYYTAPVAPATVPRYYEQASTASCQKCANSGVGCASCPYVAPKVTPSIVNNYYRSKTPTVKTANASTQISGRVDKIITGTPREINAVAAVPPDSCFDGACRLKQLKQ